MEPNEETVDMPSGKEEDISAILTESIQSSSRSAEIGPEDAAWADSCLILDPQMSEDSWDALRGALLTTLTAPAVFDDDGPSESPPDKIAEEIEQETNEQVQPEETAEPGGAAGNEDDNAESLFGSQEGIESRDNIFKVWELEAQADEGENELVKQLKKALAETKYSGPSQPGSVDELAAGMGDLSLEPPSEIESIASSN